jgi:diadenosine tetraphosphatase ApaH/serine/threonine PP2A family protein phosphatase
MVYVGPGGLQWLDLLGHTGDSPRGRNSLHLEGDDLQRGGERTLEQYDVVQHFRLRTAGCGYIGHSHRKHWNKPQPDLHLESSDRLNLVLPVGEWTERDLDPTMVFLGAGELQWDDLFGDTFNNPGRWSLYLVGGDI